MQLSALSTLRMIESTMTAAGVEMPASLAAATAQQKTMIDRAGKLGADGRLALEEAVMEALRAGKDPAADTNVRRVITARQIADMGPQLVQLIDGDLRAVLRAHRDEIVAALQPAFDEDIETLKAAHKRIGALDLSNTEAILALGNDIGDVWTAAHKAATRAESIRKAWTLLSELTAFSADRNLPTLAIVEHNLATSRDYPRASIWELVQAGLPIKLATFAEYPKRQQQLAQQSAAEAQQDMDRITGRDLTLARRLTRS